MTVTLADGGHLQLQKKALVTTDIQPKRGATLDQKGGKNGDQIHSDEEEEDCTSSTVMQHDLLLNYGMGMGHPEVAAWVREHVAAQHRPPARDWDTCMTVGSTDAIYKVLTLLLEKGDILLTDEFTLGDLCGFALISPSFISSEYSNALEVCGTLGLRARGVPLDRRGPEPGALRAACRALRPKALYTVPTGQNPTGLSMDEDRKREIYAVAQEFDLIIIEDDAYYYLQYPPYEEDADGQTVPRAPSAMPGLGGGGGGGGGGPLGRSFLSLDTDGRVVRLDTTSKALCPGLRLGWVSGPRAFVRKYRYFNESTCVMASGLSQSVFLATVRQWGADGLDAHLRAVQAYFCRQRDLAVAAARRHLVQPGLAKVVPPVAGMFLWIQASSNKKDDDIARSTQALTRLLIEAKILMVPGAHFYPPPSTMRATKNSASSDEVHGQATCERQYLPTDTTQTCLRATFATAGPDALDAAFARLAGVLSVHCNNEGCVGGTSSGHQNNRDKAVVVEIDSEVNHFSKKQKMNEGGVGTPVGGTEEALASARLVGEAPVS